MLFLCIPKLSKGSGSSFFSFSNIFTKFTSGSRDKQNFCLEMCENTILIDINKNILDTKTLHFTIKREEKLK